MKVEYWKRATADLRKVAQHSRAFGEMVAAAVEVRIREIFEQIAEYPESRPAVIERPGVHVAALVRYPYKLFYRIFDDRVRILHIRHARGIGSMIAEA
jgi:plasmid stabilization system protein ParE